jgi:hypothetical protein
MIPTVCRTKHDRGSILRSLNHRCSAGFAGFRRMTAAGWWRQKWQTDQGARKRQKRRMKKRLA